jgi:hypothetical protein
MGTTYVLVIVDKSGSMQPLAADVIGGFNGYLDERRDQPDAEDVRLTLVVFDRQVITLYADKTPSRAHCLDRSNYFPHDGTALIEAIARTLTNFDTLHPVLADDEKVMVMIYTDGLENSSHPQYTTDSVARMIEAKEETHKWAFTFVGADREAVLFAAKLGFSSDMVISAPHTGDGMRGTFRGLGTATVAYASGTTTGSAGVTRTYTQIPGLTGTDSVA